MLYEHMNVSPMMKHGDLGWIRETQNMETWDGTWRTRMEYRELGCRRSNIGNLGDLDFHVSIHDVIKDPYISRYYFIHLEN